jgi:hypothetical protein
VVGDGVVDFGHQLGSVPHCRPERIDHLVCSDAVDKASERKSLTWYRPNAVSTAKQTSCVTSSAEPMMLCWRPNRAGQYGKIIVRTVANS